MPAFKDSAAKTVPKALKCAISVTAGILPDEPRKDLTRAWNLTSEDIRDETHRYIDTIAAAQGYALRLMDPGLVNWVRVDWIWM